MVIPFVSRESRRAKEELIRDPDSPRTNNYNHMTIVREHFSFWYGMIEHYIYEDNGLFDFFLNDMEEIYSKFRFHQRVSIGDFHWVISYLDAMWAVPMLEVYRILCSSTGESDKEQTAARYYNILHRPEEDKFLRELSERYIKSSK